VVELAMALMWPFAQLTAMRRTKGKARHTSAVAGTRAMQYYACPLLLSSVLAAGRSLISIDRRFARPLHVA
jgi:hypothetical protein